MQRKEGTVAHIAHTHKVRDVAVRAAGPNLPGGGGGLLDPASGSAHVDLYAGTSPSWSRSPGAPRATPPRSELGS
jgi:hypothetical protein